MYLFEPFNYYKRSVADLWGGGNVPQRRKAVIVVINKESAHWQSCNTRYSCGGHERQSKPAALLLLLLLLLLAYDAGGGALGFHEGSDVVEV